MASSCLNGQIQAARGLKSQPFVATSGESLDRADANVDAQSSLTTSASTASTKSCKRTHVDIEKLNFLGADVSYPPFADSITQADNPVRRAMLCYDMTYQIVSIDRFTFDMLHAPVAKSQQAYVGERPTWWTGTSYALITDLHNIHLTGYQLSLTGFVARGNWYPSAPKALKMAVVMLYKPFFQQRFEVKGGYQDNDSEFIGMHVGGAMSSGSQGVYAVLPYEVGLAFMPLSAPTFVVRAQPWGGLYGKAGVQRSSSPSGGQADIARDFAGFRFDPQGDGALSIVEGGFRRDARVDAPEVWVRGGYMADTTRYVNARTGTETGGNYCAFMLADGQLRKNGDSQPRHGLYLGASAMTVPAELNAYTRYYELRLYQLAPFISRPADTASVVFTYTGYSRFKTDELLAAGKTAATHSVTMSASYSVHVRQGTFLSTVLSYNSRPAITPRLSGAFTVMTQASIFF